MTEFLSRSQDRDDPASARPVNGGESNIPEIRILPFDRTFSTDDGEKILLAALRQGFYLRHGCKIGGCGTCKAKLVEGEVDLPPGLMALSRDEEADGWVLLCSSTPSGNCTIDISIMELNENEFLDESMST